MHLTSGGQDKRPWDNHKDELSKVHVLAKITKRQFSISYINFGYAFLPDLPTFKAAIKHLPK